MTTPLPVVIFGASGHAKVVVDAARRAGLAPVAILDDAPDTWGRTLAGVPVLGGRDALAQVKERGVVHALVAVGANRVRLAIAAWLAGEGMAFPAAVHPSAVVDASAIIGPGSVVMAGAVINADARTGSHVIINTGATVDHDCVLGDGVHVAPGAHLCGGVKIGSCALVGVGAAVTPGRTIGENARVGAGAAVVADVPPAMTVVGVPARPITKE